MKKNKAKMQKLINKPTFQRVKKYKRDLVVFQMRKNRVILDKPRYIGTVILNLSKCIMYDFHYNYVLKTFPSTKLLFSDTDSFCYYIETDENLYETIKSSSWFDFSNFPKDHALYDESKKLVPGFYKDEFPALSIREFVGLRSKMYSILTSNNDKKAACKGIQTHIKDKVLKHENYKECLFKEEKRFDTIYQIANEEHNLLTIKKVKNSLSPFDNKKWIERDGNEFISLSFGHFRIRMNEGNGDK